MAGVYPWPIGSVGLAMVDVRDIADAAAAELLRRERAPHPLPRTTIELETPYTAREVAKLADVVHGSGDQAASISSGSFRTEGMIIAPCSMKTLAGIRTGYADGLVARAADVCLKERRRLVLVPRETPLSDVHLENMLALSRMGATILPPVPAFYNHTTSLADVVYHWQGGRNFVRLDPAGTVAHVFAVRPGATGSAP